MPEPIKTETPPKTEKKVSLPPPVGKIKGTSREPVLQNWKEQYASKTLHRCGQEGCYYPLEHIRNDIGEMKVVDGKFAMKCTWDPEHAGGQQLVSPPKKEGELSDDLS